MSDLLDNQAALRLTYDGEAIREHRIDARELAISLIGVVDAVEEANRLTNGDRAKAVVQVEGQVREGSVEVQTIVEVVSQGTMIAGTAFAFAQTDSAKNLVENVLGVIRIYKELRNRKVRTVEKSESGNITVNGDIHIDASIKQFELSKDARMRESVRKAANPLKAKGIESLRLEVDADRFVELTKEEVEAEILPDPEPEEDDGTITTEGPQLLKVRKVDFDGDTQWKFHDGNRTLTARIEDHGFIGKVKSGQYSFSGNELLSVRMRKTQNKKTLKTISQVIVKVNGIRNPSGGKQDEFPF